MNTLSADQMLRENEELRRRLEEAEETLRAIQAGEVDAVLVKVGGEQVYTLESADRPYRLLVEQMPQGAATLTPEGVLLYCNRHFADLLGRPLEALLGQPADGFVSPAARPLFEALLREGQEGSSRGEVTLERADGTGVPVYLGVNALREGAVGLCLMVTDLTDQKRHEALVAAEALARSILEQAVDAIVVCDDAGKVVRASRGAHALCAQNPLCRPFEAAFPLRRSAPEGDGVAGPAEVSLGPVLGGAMLRGLDVCLESPDGRRASLLLSAGSLRDAGGRVTGTVITLTDITERKQMEEALRRAHDELERRVEERTGELKAAQQQVLQAERLATIGQTMAALAHEGRNALQRGQNYLERLRWRLQDRPEALALADEVQNAQDDLLRLYEDVRGYAAPIRVDYRRCDLAAVWREAWAELAPARAGRDARLREETGGLDLALEADPFRLKQVFRNILDNSLAASPDPVVIDVTCAGAAVSGRPGVRVSVRDNGPGLTPEQRRYFFEPFYTTKTKGTGLGLAIAKRVIEAHGGQIAAGEAAGPGAEIILRLPRSRA